MKQRRARRIAFSASVCLAVLVLICGVAAGQDLKGVINGRSGATMTVQSQTGGNVVVLLTPSTSVDEVEGVLKIRKKELGVTALVPGLQVEVQGSYNAQNQLVADVVKFKGSALQNAEGYSSRCDPHRADGSSQPTTNSEEPAGDCCRETETTGATAATPGGATSDRCERCGDCGQQSGNRGRQQTLRGVGRLQHSG